MCINKLNVAQLVSSDKFAKMHTPVQSHTVPSSTNTTEHNTTHKESDKLTTVCTQCSRVLLPSIRVSNEDGQWVAPDVPTYQSTRRLSHGLCRDCFNKINTELLSHGTSTSTSTTSTKAKRLKDSILSKSLPSPFLSRHLPSRPKRVMIVDDNKLQRQIHKRMVENAGYECDIAESGEVALELMHKHSYSFILMDLIMSPMDGWTTSKKIRSYLLQVLGFSSSSPKIIAVTGLNADEKVMKQCKDAGMDEVLHKPISVSMLNKAFHDQPCTPAPILDR